MLWFREDLWYMGPVDARIAAPRLSSPRSRVAAGLVGIAGFQMGIYPFEAPGGVEAHRPHERTAVRSGARPTVLVQGGRSRAVFGGG